ncbi:MAG: amino acid adenylation domain-containing protein, partial [Alteromonadaceae bacterium]|nr:amino acid adenylation domain-containing protein [Alteromonadaceae bacterium]
MLAIINKLSEAGIHVYLDDGKLKTRASKNSMSPELISIIRSNKDQLIAFLASSDGDLLTPGRKRSEIKPFPRGSDPIPLSFAQQRLWFIDRLEGGSPEYNIPMAVPINEAFNLDAAEQAFARIVQRHEPLRTVFAEGEEGPIQIIQEHVTFKLTCYDLSALAPEQQAVRARALITQEQQKVFDLSRDLMLRGAYLDLSGDDDKQEGILLYTLHHIAADGWSMEIVSKEFSAQYQVILANKPDPLVPLEVQYVDYAWWQREWLAGEVLERQLAYWDQQLLDVPAVHSLPLDFTRPSMKSHVGAVISESFSAELSQGLIRLARQYEVTPFMLLHGALALVLSRHSNTHDIVIGTPMANRMQSELEPLIGFFINTLVLRTNTNHENFHDYLNHVKAVNLDAQENQDVPFDSLVERCQLPRSTQHSPLFQIMLIMNTNTSANTSASVKDRSHSEGVRFSADTVTKFDLTLDAKLSDTGGYLSWGYDVSLFSRAHIETFNAHLQRLLAAIVETPESQLKDLMMLSDKEIHQLTHVLNDTQANYPEDKLIHELFEQQVEISPEAIAVVFSEQQLSYQALNQQSNQLAHYLIEKGVKADTLVGICVDRSLNMIVGLLAILKAGGAYVPLDPNYPKKRLGYLIEDSGIQLILTDTAMQTSLGLKALISEQSGIERDINCVLFDDDTFDHWQSQRFVSHNPAVALHSSNLAYVIYTSGSTGKPKGVGIQHTSVVSLLTWSANELSIDDRQGVLASTSMCFDLSVYELFLPLISGTQCILIDSILSLGDLPQRDSITLINTVPSAAKALLEEGTLPSSVRVINLAGEPLKSSLVDDLYQTSNVKRVYDLYGPSETTTYSTFTLRALSGLETIGRPVANTQAYIVGLQGEVTPSGVVGELYLGGAGLSRGYLNRAALTAEKFVPHPYSQVPGERLYCTGDVVRYMSDSSGCFDNIEYMGRIDHQIKIRGFRIELGEIENALLEHKWVNDALVVAREDGQGNNCLVAYVVREEKSSETESEQAVSIKAALQTLLPEYMVPSTFVFIEKWPLTVNGKIDKKALPEPDGTLLQGEYEAPMSETEQVLVTIWAKLLKLDAETISVKASFFEIGGHSLLAVRLVAEIRTRLAQEIAIKAVFGSPSIRELALQIDAGSSLLLRQAVTPIQREGNKLALSFAQERLWFIDRLEGGSPEYNMPMVVPINEAFNVDAAEQAFARIVQRHEPLRTVFAEGADGPIQIIQEEVVFTLTRYDLSGLAPEQQAVRARALITQEQQKVFDLSRDLMLRGAYLDLSGDDDKQEGILLYTLHHIAADGWSMEIVSKEFSAQYQVILANKPDPLVPLEVQYVDYAWWQREWLAGEVLERQLAYWDQQLLDVPAVHS